MNDGKTAITDVSGHAARLLCASRQRSIGYTIKIFLLGKRVSISFGPFHLNAYDRDNRQTNANMVATTRAASARKRRASSTHSSQNKQPRKAVKPDDASSIVMIRASDLKRHREGQARRRQQHGRENSSNQPNPLDQQGRGDASNQARRRQHQGRDNSSNQARRLDQQGRSNTNDQAHHLQQQARDDSSNQPPRLQQQSRGNSNNQPRITAGRQTANQGSRYRPNQGMKLRLGRRPQAPSEAEEEEPYHISYGGNNEAERDQRILGWVGGVVGNAATEDQNDALESEEPIEGAESGENDDDDDDNEDEDENEDEAQEGNNAEELASVVYTDSQVGVDDDRRLRANTTRRRGTRGNARARAAARIRAQLDRQALQLSPRHRGGAHAFIALLHDSHFIPLLDLDKTAAEPYQSSNKYQPARLGGYGYGDNRDPKRRALAFLDDYYPREQKAATKHFDRDDPKNQGIDFEYESSPSYDDSAELAPVRLCRQVPVSRATSSEPAVVSSHPYDTAFCRPVSKRKHSAIASESDSQSHRDRDWYPNLGYERHNLDYGSEPHEDRDYFPHQMCLLDYDGEVQPMEEPRSDADASAEDSEAGGDNDKADSVSGGSRAASENNTGGGQSGGDDGEGDREQYGQSEHGGSASSSDDDPSESENDNGSEGESGNGSEAESEDGNEGEDDEDDDDDNNASPVTPGRYIPTNQVLTPRGGFPNVPFAGPQTRQNTAPNRMRDQPLSPGQGYVSVPVAETQGAQILYGYEQGERDGEQASDGESQAGESGGGESGGGESGEGESEDGQSVKEESVEGESDDGESEEDENVKAESDDGNSNDASRDNGEVD